MAIFQNRIRQVEELIHNYHRLRNGANPIVESDITKLGETFVLMMLALMSRDSHRLSELFSDMFVNMIIVINGMSEDKNIHLFSDALEKKIERMSRRMTCK